MPRIEHYDPGRFCWADLATSDVAAATAFYTGLLGWGSRVDHTEHGDYTLLTRDGGDICGLYALTPQQTQAGVPPHWLPYVAVADPDATAAQALELGGTVVMPAMDVLDYGRMAVIQDPHGATFAAWAAKKNTGSAFFGEVGSACWFELMSRDAAAAKAFYSGLFGWQPDDQEMADPSGQPMNYTMWMFGEAPAGGMMQIGPEFPPEVPSHWMVYYAVPDCDASCATVSATGGQVRVPPTDIPGIGRFAVITDPQGAVFSVIALAPQEPGAEA